jgi:hypothetical protein
MLNRFLPLLAQGEGDRKRGMGFGRRVCFQRHLVIDRRFVHVARRLPLMSQFTILIRLNLVAPER